MDGWYSEAGVTRDDVDLVTTMDQDPNYVIILSKNKTGADGIMLFYLKQIGVVIVIIFYQLGINYNNHMMMII